VPTLLVRVLWYVVWWYGFLGWMVCLNNPKWTQIVLALVGANNSSCILGSPDIVEKWVVSFYRLWTSIWVLICWSAVSMHTLHTACWQRRIISKGFWIMFSLHLVTSGTIKLILLCCYFEIWWQCLYWFYGYSSEIMSADHKKHFFHVIFLHIRASGWPTFRFQVWQVFYHPREPVFISQVLTILEIYVEIRKSWFHPLEIRSRSCDWLQDVLDRSLSQQRNAIVLWRFSFFQCNATVRLCIKSGDLRCFSAVMNAATAGSETDWLVVYAVV